MNEILGKRVTNFKLEAKQIVALIGSSAKELRDCFETIEECSDDEELIEVMPDVKNDISNVISTLEKVLSGGYEIEEQE